MANVVHRIDRTLTQVLTESLQTSAKLASLPEWALMAKSII